VHQELQPSISRADKGTVPPLAASHALTPPERRFAAFILKRQQTHRTPAILRLEGNYGPEGMVLFSTTLLWGLCEAFCGVLALVLLFATGGLTTPTIVFALLTFALFCPTLLRGFQTAKAGKAFRGNRPFVR
jgi:hypothetical protein